MKIQTKMFNTYCSFFHINTQKQNPCKIIRIQKTVKIVLLVALLNCCTHTAVVVHSDKNMSGMEINIVGMKIEIKDSNYILMKINIHHDTSTSSRRDHDKNRGTSHRHFHHTLTKYKMHKSSSVIILTTLYFLLFDGKTTDSLPFLLCILH